MFLSNMFLHLLESVPLTGFEVLFNFFIDFIAFLCTQIMQLKIKKTKIEIRLWSKVRVGDIVNRNHKYQQLGQGKR